MKTKIYNLLILDESGSMMEIKSATMRGFNEVVQTIKSAELQFPEQEHLISLVTFNSNGIRTKLDRAKAADLMEISEDSFQPNSGTPLFDAIGTSVIKLRNDIRTEDNVGVLVTILTDGEENSSREYSGKLIKQIIEDQKRKGWTFTYIGANHDVESTAESLSINNHLSFEGTEEDTNQMFARERIARMNHYSRRSFSESSVSFFEKSDKPKEKKKVSKKEDELPSESFLDRLVKKIKT